MRRLPLNTVSCANRACVSRGSGMYIGLPGIQRDIAWRPARAASRRPCSRPLIVASAEGLVASSVMAQVAEGPDLA